MKPGARPRVAVIGDELETPAEKYIRFGVFAPRRQLQAGDERRRRVDDRVDVGPTREGGPVIGGGGEELAVVIAEPRELVGEFPLAALQDLASQRREIGGRLVARRVLITERENPEP